MNKESIFLILVGISLVPLGITYGTHPSLSLIPIPFLDDVEINSIDPVSYTHLRAHET